MVELVDERFVYLLRCLGRRAFDFPICDDVSDGLFSDILLVYSDFMCVSFDFFFLQGGGLAFEYDVSASDGVCDFG